MSSSVSIAIATNSMIAVSKGFGWFVTGSPTLFAETVHSLADVGNQVLLKVGEVRGREGPSAEHPFGHAQEKYFWALVSAVSVFFIGCGINIYHGIVALLHPRVVEPFSMLVIGLLLFALVLESWTFGIAFKEIGGWRGARENRHNVTVLAVLLEDSVALIGILLTLLVAGVSYLVGPHPVFDAWVAIVVGVLLGVMAFFLAAINRTVLIDTSDRELDTAVKQYLAERGIAASVHSLVLDHDRAIVFVHARREIESTSKVAEALRMRMFESHQKIVDKIYWRFAPSAPSTVDG